MDKKKIQKAIEKLYNRNHCNKWKDLTDDERDDYFKRNLKRLERMRL